MNMNVPRKTLIGHPGKKGTLDHLIEFLLRDLDSNAVNQMRENLDSYVYSPSINLAINKNYKVQDLEVMQKIRTALQRRSEAVSTE